MLVREAKPTEKQIETLAFNEGIKIEREGKKLGAYRDGNGNLFYLDLTCTHEGCEVNWNEEQHTWDCPCHGSRFDGNGRVIEGPADKDLKKINP